jgi:hypothetical protein
MDEDIKQLLTILIEGQTRTDKSVGDLAVLIGQSHDRLEQSHDRLEAAHLKTEESLQALNLSIQRFTDAANERYKRLEENLDGLIRAITREHSNGKGN